MKADQIRVQLLPHAHKRLHEGGADLAPEQSADLEERFRWRSASAGWIDCDDEHEQGGQRERLADRLKDLRGQKVIGCPLGW